MILGLAIGDGLGNTSESTLPGERQARYGEIRDYLPNRYADGQAVGLPSDDSQLASWTLEQLLADDGLIPERLADRFCQEQIFGIGRTVRQFIGNRRDRGLPWEQCGPQSAGNGSLMRIAPILLPHLRHNTTALWADTALAAMVTHNDRAAIAACLCFVWQLWHVLALSTPPPADWWLDSYLSLARDLEGDSAYTERIRDRPAPYRGPIWQYVAQQVGPAYADDLSVRRACDRWYSGAYLMETLPSVLYILMRHADDPEEAIVRAVNDTRDNDTVAAIVGAAVGALHGTAALPARWTARLSGRTNAQDDGRLFALLQQARARWWH